MLCGMEAMHGPHQVAQKSTMTTLPRLALMEVSLPIHESMESAGAGLPSRALRGAGRWAPSKNQSSGNGFGEDCAIASPPTRRPEQASTASKGKRSISFMIQPPADIPNADR